MAHWLECENIIENLGFYVIISTSIYTDTHQELQNGEKRALSYFDLWYDLGGVLTGWSISETEQYKSCIFPM